MKSCTVFRLGTIPYDEALSFQFELTERVREKKGKVGYLMLLEHHPVITIGKNGNSGNVLVPEEVLKKKKIVVRRIDRGGDVTYHGPGQLVGYPIFALSYLKKSIREYVRALEQCMIDTLAAFNVEATPDNKSAGVWAGDAKIGFIGVRVSRGITYHGFSLNVEPDMANFELINPCGMKNPKITSINKLIDKKANVNDVAKEYMLSFSKLFDLKPVVVKTHLSYIPKA